MCFIVLYCYYKDYSSNYKLNYISNLQTTRLTASIFAEKSKQNIIKEGVISIACFLEGSLVNSYTCLLIQMNFQIWRFYLCLRVPML